MDPFSRGKRMLEMSLQSQQISTPRKRQKLSGSPKEAYCQNQVSSVLDISSFKLGDLPDDLNFSISSLDLSLNFNDLPPLSSALKVANFIINQNEVQPTNTTEKDITEMPASVGEVGGVRGHVVNEDGMADDKHVSKGDATYLRNAPLLPLNSELDEGAVQDGGDTLQTSRVGETCLMEVDNDTAMHTVGQSEQVRDADVVSDGNSAEVSTSRHDDSETRGPQKGRLNKKVEKKHAREHGKSYIGRKLNKDTNKFVEVTKDKNKLGPRCSCKASYNRCKDVSDDVRERIHKEVWSMTWDEKKVFTKLCVQVKDVKERKGASENYRRNNTFIFNLRSREDWMRVCKDMFLSTTGMKKLWIFNTMAGSDTIPAVTQEKGAVSAGMAFVREFLDRLPKMPSHYCRRDTAKLYLEPVFHSYADIYREYMRICEAEGKSRMSRTIFIEEMKTQNISIFSPRKDQCDLCCEYEQGNTDEAKYNAHRLKKEAAQAEKTKDKIHFPLNSRTKVVCVDVQRVLLAPALKASALYYKTKLQMHNYTIFDMITKDAICFLWTETEGGLNASEFASCLETYLVERSDSFDNVIIYSDGCTYQNRNRVLATALRHFSIKHHKTVEQKILECGHTQMEVDSVHATIERRLKNMDIYSPFDYVHLIRAARVNPKPYEARYLTFDFFKDFDTFEEGNLKSIKPSKNANVTDIRALRYRPDGSLSFKLNFGDEWQTLSLGRRDKLPMGEPKQLHKCQIQIKTSKYQHLQSLKSVLPSVVHHFYDTLPHQ